MKPAERADSRLTRMRCRLYASRALSWASTPSSSDSSSVPAAPHLPLSPPPIIRHFAWRLCHLHTHNPPLPGKEA